MSDKGGSKKIDNSELVNNKLYSILFKAPKEDRPAYPKKPIKKIKKEAKDINREKLIVTEPVTQKRIPPHPILEIIGSDGKTLMKKK